MTDQEKAALKNVVHYMIDQEEGAIIDAELAKITDPSVLAVAKVLEASLLPVLIKQQDAAVDAKLG